MSLITILTIKAPSSIVEILSYFLLLPDVWVIWLILVFGIAWVRHTALKVGFLIAFLGGLVLYLISPLLIPADVVVLLAILTAFSSYSDLFLKKAK